MDFRTLKVQVGNDQLKGAIRKKFPLQKPKWEKTKLTKRHVDKVYSKTVIGRNVFFNVIRLEITLNVIKVCAM